MEKSDLDESLNRIINRENEADIAIYALLKDGQLNLFDIHHEDLTDLKKEFVGSLKRDVVDFDGALKNLSAADERRKAIYRYDLDMPEALGCLNQILELWRDSNTQLPVFNVRNSSVAEIDALIIRLATPENCVVLYKDMASINLFSRTQRFYIKRNDRFESISDEFVRISDNFQFFETDDENVFIRDLEKLEKFFGFHEVIKNEAKKGADAVDRFGIVEDIAPLYDLIEDVSSARKLSKIAQNSPVIKNDVAREVIIDFCKKHPSLKGRIRFNQNESQIVLDTKVSKYLLIGLLMDDYLTSNLTRLHYESLAKDEVGES